MTLPKRAIGASEVTPSLLQVLAVVEKRPSIYLGYDESHRGEQLDALESFIAGYSAAVYNHRLDDEGVTIYATFPEFLRDRFGWSMSCGPISAIREHADDDAAAWDLFWTLLWEAQQTQRGEGHG